jgi:hypothetical protein
MKISYGFLLSLLTGRAFLVEYDQPYYIHQLWDSPGFNWKYHYDLREQCNCETAFDKAQLDERLKQIEIVGNPKIDLEEVTCKLLNSMFIYFLDIFRKNTCSGKATTR